MAECFLGLKRLTLIKRLTLLLVQSSSRLSTITTIDHVKAFTRNNSVSLTRHCRCGTSSGSTSVPGPVSSSSAYSLRNSTNKSHDDGKSEARLPSQDEKTTSRCIGQPMPETHPHLMQPSELTPGITRKEYKERRHRLMSILGNTHSGRTYQKHVVIVTSSPTKFMTADIPYPFHQNNDFLYLTGFQEPDAVLVLESKANESLPSHNFVMFARPRDLKRELWDGPRAGLEAIVDYFGADEAFPISSLASILHERYSNRTHCIWYNHMEVTHPKLHQDIAESLFNNRYIQYKALHVVGDNLQILRLIKSPAEVKLMKKTASIGAKAFKKVILSTRPGLGEGDMHALLEYECKMHGAQWLSFPPVVANGDTANTLHYINNTQLLRDGDLVLMDGGCEYHGYASDITRTWPVSGKFTANQKQLYQVVLNVQRACLKHCRIGVSLDYLYDVMLTTLGTELQDLDLIDKNISQTELKKAAKQFCPHHVGHYLGMDTHDTALIHRGLGLEPGMVITVEPGLYIPKHFYHVPDKYRGIGIRIEDDVLLTEDGPVVLSAECPKEIHEIEALMQQR